jgi:uncharacterized membrane protein YdjX (TVP38/TMEM64 family)
VYTIADKAEDITTGKLGRYFGITQGQIEALGARVGTGFRGLVTLTVLRALPFIPSVLVSVGGGVLKVPLGSFMISTFLGTIIRDAFYLYAGYAGVHLLGAFISHSGSLETLIEIGVVVLVLAFLGYRLYKRRTTASHQ